MMSRKTAVLAIATIVALLAACDRESPDGKTEAEAREPTSEQTAVKPGADDRSGEQPKKPSESPGPPTSLEELPEGVNVLQHEMQLLLEAMRQTLTLIANDNLEAIPAQFKKVHPARKMTMKALEQGKYEPPINADEMETFERLDDQFHSNLKGLLKAAKEDDLAGAANQYGKLVDGCANCHKQFRFE
ncbi:MAG: cytochrome c [Bradymonadaceae bacterium]